MKTKTVKLTPKQQEVVNLMADGWTLHWGSSIGHRDSGHSWMRNKGETRSVMCGLETQLKNKGVVEVKKHDWQQVSYVLTEFGKSLAMPIETPATVTWWTFGFDWEDKPKSEQFVRETDAYLIRADGRKESKVGGCGNWYATKAECIEAKRERLEKNAVRARVKLQDEEEKLAKFNKLYPKGGAA